LKQTKLFGEPVPKVLLKLELSKAQALAAQIEALVKSYCEKLQVVGSIRRQKPMVGDIDFVAVATDANWTKIVQTFKKSHLICAGNSLLKVNFPCNGGFFQVDFYRATLATFGIQMLIRSGSAEHNVWLASYAISKDMRLKYSQGLLKDGVVVAGESEEGMFSALGLPCPEPKEREVVNGKPLWSKSKLPEE
jgi:DNA polymerase (family X)